MAAARAVRARRSTRRPYKSGKEDRRAKAQRPKKAEWQTKPEGARLLSRARKRRRSWTEVTFCRQDVEHRFTDISEQEIAFPCVPAPNTDEFDADEVPTTLFQDAAAAGRAAQGAPLGGPATTGGSNVLQCNPSESHQDSFQSDRMNNEHDADAVPFLPRFLLQELILAHCPHQSRSSFRGNFLSRADWLSLGGIAGVELTFCRSAYQPTAERAPSCAPDPARHAVKYNNQLTLGFRPQHAQSNPAIVIGIQQPLPAALSHVGTSETLENGRPYTALVSTCPARSSRLWAPTMNEKDATLEAMQEQPGWEDPLPLAQPRVTQLQRGVQAVADAAGRSALKGSTYK